MKKQATCAIAFILIVAGWIAVSHGNVHAQESSLNVIITRPGDGETLYASPTSPFVSAQITGWVGANDFDVRQLQVRLEIFQGTKSFGSATTTPRTDGTYSFDVAINPTHEASKSSAEHGCKGNCHALTALGFPSGAVLLRVTATDPLGRKATAQRSIIVDQAGYADLPVRVMVAGDPNQVVEGLTVVCDTRLYQWRARQYTAKTDAKGQAVVHLEALAQAPTRYLLHVEPTVLDGVLYRSREPLQMTLAPGTTTAEPVTLIAESLRGHVEGTIDWRGFGLSASSNPTWGLTVRAVELPRGVVYTTKTTRGQFAFSDLLLSKYVLIVDDEEAAAQGAQAAPQTVDLIVSPVASATLTLMPVQARVARGVVHDSSGNPLPLAWIATEDRGKTARVSPLSGEFALYGLLPETHALWVTAPGYWSRPVVLSTDRLDVTLAPQPDTRIISWGSGAMTLPAQTLANLSRNRLALKRGWVWGKGSGSFSINTPDLDIALQTSAFALEYSPGGTSWFYVREGQAQVTVAATDETLTVSAGQMLAFGKGATRPSVVALDDVAVRALHAGETSPLLVETDPSAPARLRDELARLGISTVQATLFAACLLAILIVISVLRRRRR